MTIYRLTEDLIFPDPSLSEPDGLLAVGGDLTENRILLAYSMGIFPWYSQGQPILWWSPDPRLILIPSQIHISKSLKRTLKSHKFTVRFDTRFHDVITICSDIDRRGQDGTWITNEMIDAYCRLHLAGFAHSVECYLGEELVGGLYGISLGKAFFGESMFSLRPDSSKVALAKLSKLLTTWNFDFIDCQVTTSHLLSMGALEISRDRFLEILSNSQAHKTQRGNWRNVISEI